MPTIQIHKGSQAQIRPNFTEGEFFTTATARSVVDLDSRIPDLAQFLRDLFGYAMLVTSTTRYPEDKSYSPDSQHSRAKALDIQPVDSARREEFAKVMAQHILMQTEVFVFLLNMGVRGFGLYDTFIHFDFREDGTGLKVYEQSRYAFWDYRSVKTAYQDGQIVTDWAGTMENFFAQPFRDYEDEQGVSLRTKWSHILLTLGLLAMGGILLFRAINRLRS